jgi:hypothetical protein
MDSTLMVDDATAVRLGKPDLPRLSDLCLCCTAFYELVEGQPATAATTAEIYDWYIGLLLVAPDRRRNGLGARFCRTLLSWMARQGAKTVRLVVHQQNVDARRFWERQGFAHEREVVKRSGLLEGTVSILAIVLLGLHASASAAARPAAADCNRIEQLDGRIATQKAEIRRLLKHSTEKHPDVMRTRSNLTSLEASRTTEINPAKSLGLSRSSATQQKAAEKSSENVDAPGNKP